MAVRQSASMHRQQNQRSGLALVNGVVYVAWASHEDTAPYYGWVVGFNASTLAVTNILNVSPNVQYGGIWMGGGAPSADANNNLYLITGNGQFDVTSGGNRLWRFLPSVVGQLERFLRISLHLTRRMTTRMTLTSDLAVRRSF